MGRSEILVGAFLMILSVAAFVLTYQFPDTQVAAFSPKIFPRFINVCLFLLSASLVGQGIRGALKQTGATQRRTDARKPFYFRLLAMFILAYAYTQVLPSVGYVIATPLFVAGTMILFNEKRWIIVAVTALLTSTLLYVLFRMVFKVPLPRFNLG